MLDRRTRWDEGTYICRWRRAGALTLALGAALGAGAQVPTLPEFEIRDQFERLHTDRDLAGRVVVVVASGRKGREANSAWGAALRSELAGLIADQRLVVLPVADVRGVPGFLKGRVRGGFSEAPERWVLLDWDGVFGEAFQLDGDVTSVLVFASDGALLARTAEGEPDAMRVALIAATAREASAAGS